MWGQVLPAKVARTGVPFYLSHTIVKAEGSDHVTGVTIAEVDNHFQFIPGTEKQFDVDTICLAVGLSPMSQLLKMAGCGMCVASCSGQAIFLVDETYEPGFVTVTLPYEFLPLPETGEKGYGLGRDGQVVCEAEVVSVKSAKSFDHTHLLTIKVPADMAMRARFYKGE